MRTATKAKKTADELLWDELDAHVANIARKTKQTIPQVWDALKQLDKFGFLEELDALGPLKGMSKPLAELYRLYPKETDVDAIGMSEAALLRRRAKGGRA